MPDADPQSPPTDEHTPRSKRGKFQRARVRNILFTAGPDRLTGGRAKKRHLAGELVVREIELASPQWPTAFDGLRIGHVSDFHLGDLLRADDAIAIVECLAAQRPDLLACTGDVVDLRINGAQPLFDAMAGASAPLGSLLVLGNHDELDDGRALTEMARESGMTVLANDAASITHNGSELIVAGTRWARRTARCSQYVRSACGERAHLLLSHNPKSFRQAVRQSIPLTLAGHTHGGQLALRSRPNLNLSLTQRHSAGAFTRGGSNLYVTTGAGAWFPLRINCPAEIAVITMRSGPVGSARDYNPDLYARRRPRASP